MLIDGGAGLRTQKAVSVGAGADRFGAARDIGGWRFECKLSARDTGGELCVYDTVRSIKGGPPLHMHREQNEWFYVRQGEFLFQVGSERLHLKAGDTLLGPRGVPHAFAALTTVSALLIIFQPAGAIEEVFAEVWALSQSQTVGLENWRRIAGPRGIEIIAPSLQIS